MWLFLTSLPLSIGSSSCNALTTDGFIVALCVAGHRQVEPFLACLNIDLSVIGGCFVSDDELLTAETSPFFFLASVPAIAAFNKPETILFVGSESCLGFIMSVSAFVTAADISLDLAFRFSVRGFFFFSESFSRHSESSFFCDVDSSLYSEFVWYHRWTPVFPILTFLSFDVESDISIALAFGPCMPQASEMFAAGRFVPAACFLAMGS